ncbi:MAG TPA: peptidoglycan DD-metalloendopeptidase family protein [Nocardioidaceae bacterium]|nr:peptidoglycan DD-metalloendopeptidase family protein [Nocardioidaceae bacterium]
MAALVLAGSMLTSLAAVPLASADTGHLKHKKHKVQRQIKGAKADLDESSSRLRHAVARLRAAQRQLDKAQAHLSKTRGQLTAAKVLDSRMQAKLDAAVQRLKSAQAELADGRQDVAEQRRTLSRLVVANYQSGSPQLMGLSMVLTTQDPAELTGQLNSVHNVMDKENAILDGLEATKVLLDVQERQVHEAKVQVAHRRAQAAANLRRKQALEQRAEAAERRVHHMVTNRAHARAQARKAKRSDMTQLRHMRREEHRISRILKRRAAAARRRAAAARRRAAAHAHAQHSNGFLDWPVRGPITSPFGWRVHPIYGYRSLHDGIDIAVDCGTPIHAPANGKVLEEYYQTAWGNRLILDNGYHRGVGLATIFNHMSGYVAHVGDYVHRGEVIGYTGTTGWSTGCHMHFTVMANGRPVDPMKWL